jgi:hypothetical protein
LRPISGAVADQARWMTLLEALAHIQRLEKCDSVVAQVQLKHAIGQGKIPVKWADSKRPKDKPNVSKLQRSQLVLSGHGLASGGLSLRPLLVLRSAVHTTWSGTTSEGATPPHENSSARRNSAQREEEEKYEQWMSLVEAIEHIRISQHCDSVEALRQLKRELSDGMVRVLWEDSEGAKDYPDPLYLQTSQLLLIGTGFAPDNEIYRPLLVERSDVQKLWPLSSHRPKGSSRAGSSSTTQPEKVSRRSVNDDEIRSAARELYRERKNDPPNKTIAEQLIRRKLGGGKRDNIRPILEEQEFSRVRREPGKQPKN